MVNSVFLYYCTKAGLDLAIVNAEKLERFASIPAEDRALAENLLFNTPPADLPADHPQQKFFGTLLRTGVSSRANRRQPSINFTSRQSPSTSVAAREKSRLQTPSSRSISGSPTTSSKVSKDGLIEDLERQTEPRRMPPLDIINGPLMAGMSEVGRLFNANELIVAEVLQSAEAMKAAVSHLEQFMEKADTVARGEIILATVKGDVHDIGKNLVEIILNNNGYEVVNLGIKVPPEELIKAYREHKPDAIGLSGLLVKSRNRWWSRRTT